MCPKCDGRMFLNEDQDMQCITCAKIIVLKVRRQYDSRSGKIRDNKKTGIGRNLDGTSEMVDEFLRDINPQNDHSEMVRQTYSRTRIRKFGLFG